jgi:hypothetical protein
MLKKKVTRQLTKASTGQLEKMSHCWAPLVHVITMLRERGGSPESQSFTIRLNKILSNIQ